MAGAHRRTSDQLVATRISTSSLRDYSPEDYLQVSQHRFMYIHTDPLKMKSLMSKFKLQYVFFCISSSIC